MFLDVSLKIEILWLHHLVIFPHHWDTDTKNSHVPIKNDATLDFGVPIGFDMTFVPGLKNPGLEDFDGATRGATEHRRPGPGKHTKNHGKHFSWENQLFRLENHQFSWETQLFLWHSTGPFSVWQTVSHYQRVLSIISPINPYKSP